MCPSTLSYKMEASEKVEAQAKVIFLSFAVGQLLKLYYVFG